MLHTTVLVRASVLINVSKFPQFNTMAPTCLDLDILIIDSNIVSLNTFVKIGIIEKILEL